MVSNQPVYDLMLIPENLKVFDTLELCQMIGIEKTELEVKLKQAKRFSVKLPSIIVSQVSKKDHAFLQLQLISVFLLLNINIQLDYQGYR